MSDVMTPEQRSRCMSRIRGRDTKPELMLRRALWSLGLRYRLKAPLPGRPDLVFRQAKVAVFVDGCFWHACPEHRTQPKANAAFWSAKIAANVDRDERVTRELTKDGWLVIRVWEHEVERDLTRTVSRIRRKLRPKLRRGVASQPRRRRR